MVWEHLCLKCVGGEELDHDQSLLHYLMDDIVKKNLDAWLLFEELELGGGGVTRWRERVKRCLHIAKLFVKCGIFLFMSDDILSQEIEWWYPKMLHAFAYCLSHDTFADESLENFIGIDSLIATDGCDGAGRLGSEFPECYKDRRFFIIESERVEVLLYFLHRRVL